MNIYIYIYTCSISHVILHRGPVFHSRPSAPVASSHSGSAPYTSFVSCRAAKCRRAWSPTMRPWALANGAWARLPFLSQLCTRASLLGLVPRKFSVQASQDGTKKQQFSGNSKEFQLAHRTQYPLFSGVRIMNTPIVTRHLLGFLLVIRPFP